MAATISVFLLAIGLYLLMGLLFSPFFLLWGLAKVDQGVIGSGIVFKLLILPGLIALWPVFARKWLKTTS